MLLKRSILCAVLLLAGACGEEPEPIRSRPPRVDPLCDSLRPRVDAAQRRIRKYEKRAQTPISPAGTEVTLDELDRIERARREYLRLRQRAVAFGCVGG
jgi:hypothetical protein